MTEAHVTHQPGLTGLSRRALAVDCKELEKSGSVVCGGSAVDLW